MWVVINKKPNSNQWDYPDTPSLFTDAFRSGTSIVAQYTGDLTPEEMGVTEYVGDIPKPEEDRIYGFKITKLAMRNRFTTAEKIAIEEASVTSAAVRVYKDDLAAAEHINLALQETIDNVNALESAGLIAVGRASEILTMEATREEAYKG